MIAKIEKHLELLAASIKDTATPKKYRDQAAKEYVKLGRDLEKIYREYSKLHLLEKKIAKKFDIEVGE